MLTSCLRFLAVFRDTQGKFKRFSASLNRAAVFPHCLRFPFRECSRQHKAPLSHIAKSDGASRPLLLDPFVARRIDHPVKKVSHPLFFWNFGCEKRSSGPSSHHRSLSSPLVSRSCMQFSSVQMLKPSLSSIAAKMPFPETSLCEKVPS